MRTAIICSVVVLITIGALADRHGLLGVREELVSDFVHIAFQFVDAESRAPISDVHIACTRPMQPSACTERRGPRAGETTITFGALKRIRRSFLFSETTGHTLGRGAVMHLTFIHPNYERATFELDDETIAAAGARQQLIELDAAAE